MNAKINTEEEGYLNAILLDVRDRSEIENTKQIRGSINIPLNELVDAFSVISEIEFKTRYGVARPSIECPIIICYQAGIKTPCALKIMQRLGFRRLYTHKGMGKFEGYRNTPMSVVGFEDVVEVESDPEVLIVDVRDRHEVANSGRIRGSVNIPLSELEQAFGRMSEAEFKRTYGRSKPNRDFPIVFSCQGGVRSTQAMRIVQKIGYRNLYNYLGGWQDYKKRKGWK